jgi:hypothetical protein
MAFILTFRERGNSSAGRGPFSTEYPTRDEARAALVEYVKENWKPELDDYEMPDDEGEMVREFFYEVLQDYDITEVG